MTDNDEYHASDSLLPGHGCTPDYGINQSTMENMQRPSEKWLKVAMSSMIACQASVVSGMVLGFSSPALTQLQFSVPEGVQISDKDVRYSLFGVCIDLQLST